MNNIQSSEVSLFLDGLNHLLRNEIELLRAIILQANAELSENIKWKGPNYSIRGEDRITMSIHTTKHIQLIFHRGAKKLEQPNSQLIEENTGLLVWKENDRAIATFKCRLDIEKAESELSDIVKKWIEATK